ncbi:uracil-DNA glycosylase family protein [Nannocystis bainbridge]|uniref:Uracil-DNA glycosylase family protein n=1 Tax=Nannocystis bainbridge TaxID=2995303 RepID=A0ABT5E8X7_9BACT|nr:uracil-DNA glycosylase family protein [Nannocystis bainbridge]MDC0722322.1 uracil-DNA glycosylase family protein [Nannocystis bainbridge]
MLHRQLEACTACPAMIGPVVHGPPIVTPVLLVGQAPGPREGGFGRPFAWTAGKTLFRWFEAAAGRSEQEFRDSVYMSAVARCFPGKAGGGGDRKPDRDEMARCQQFLAGEVDILQPRLVIPVGGVAIEQVLGHKGPLVEVIGEARRVRWHGVEADAICLPHPSGASTWHRVEPGRTLLARALALIARHPAFVAAFTGRAETACAAASDRTDRHMSERT